MVLHNIVKEKDDKFEEFLSFLGSQLTRDKVQKINQHFLNEWNIHENLMPQLNNVESETIAAAEATRPTSTVAPAQEERLHYDLTDMKDFGKLIEFFSTK
jgi:hypothetical protein